MAEQSLTKNIMKKGIMGVVLGIILVVAARATHFPEVFQIMFFIYAMLGAFVFILLDAPSMNRLEGGKAIIGLLLFYVIISGAYIGGASSLPQFDPEIEKGKIEKILKRRRAKTKEGHKLFGHGGKKRGPKLDNIGNLMTPEQLRQKILDPKSWKAEGFDKQYKKGKMPDKYKDLMFDEEVDALVAFLATLKDATVDTPKPIKMK